MNRKELAAHIAAQLKERGVSAFAAAVVLGSGWDGVVSFLEDKTVIPYAELDGMPKCGVKGHAGNFVFGRIGNKNVVVLQGRFHMYEGRSAGEAVLPIEIVRALGVDNLILTNAAGAVNEEYRTGDIMLLRDHINLTGRNPLEGVGAEPDFPVFIDMSGAYDEDFRRELKMLSEKAGLCAHEGVYAQLLGPSYETPAEIVMLRRIGADAVGMSTAVEAIYARYLKMRVAAISCISNMAAGIHSASLAHEEVLEVLQKNRDKLSVLLRDFIERV